MCTGPLPGRMVSSRPKSGTGKIPAMPNALLLSNLEAMRTSLGLLHRTGFAQRATSLNQQLAKVEVEARKPMEVDANSLAVGLVELPEALPSIVAGVLLAVRGFEDGDVLSGVQGLMDTCAGLAPVIGGIIGLSVGSLAGGVGAGPGAQLGALIGMAVGSIFSLISEILGVFRPAGGSRRRDHFQAAHRPESRRGLLGDRWRASLVPDLCLHLERQLQTAQWRCRCSR